MNFCEENLCAWVKQPANTFSNLGFIFVGFFILWHTHRRDRPARSASLRAMPFMAMFLGLSSMFYHSSMIFAAEVADLASMYFFSTLMFTVNLKRLGWLSNKNWTAAYIGINIASIALLLFHKPFGIDIFAAQVIGSILMELRLFLISIGKAKASKQPRGMPRADYRLYFAALGLFGLAYVIWNLDYHHFVCEPKNHWIQGHAVWHILDALTFFTLYFFYRPFDRFFVPSINHQNRDA